MGVDEGNIRDVHPSVLSVTGPQQYEQVVNKGAILTGAFAASDQKVRNSSERTVA